MNGVEMTLEGSMPTRSKTRCSFNTRKVSTRVWMDLLTTHYFFFFYFLCRSFFRLLLYWCTTEDSWPGVCHFRLAEDGRNEGDESVEQWRCLEKVFGLSTFELNRMPVHFYSPVSVLSFQQLPELGFLLPVFRKSPFWVWKTAALLSSGNRHFDRSGQTTGTPLFTP